MQVEGDFDLHRFYFHGGLIMERMEALTNYYTTHNEDARLQQAGGIKIFHSSSNQKPLLTTI